MIHNYKTGDIVFLRNTSLQVEETKLAYVYKRYHGNPAIKKNGEINVLGIGVVTIDKEIIPFIPIKEYKQSLIFVSECFYIYIYINFAYLEADINFILILLDNLGYNKQDYLEYLDECKTENFTKNMSYKIPQSRFNPRI